MVTFSLHPSQRDPHSRSRSSFFGGGRILVYITCSPSQHLAPISVFVIKSARRPFFISPSSIRFDNVWELSCNVEFFCLLWQSKKKLNSLLNKKCFKRIYSKPHSTYSEGKNWAQYKQTTYHSTRP